jgi:DNA-binding XRE family transcriptional regulator
MGVRTVGRQSRPHGAGGRRRAKDQARSESNTYALGEVRRSRSVTQVELAKRLDVAQATVSKFEKSNPAVSTVRRYVEALGGHLQMIAVFDDGELVLDY